MGHKNEDTALKNYVDETAWYCIENLSADDRIRLLKCDHITAHRLACVEQIQSQYIDHVENLHMSELQFDISPDDLSFLVIQRILDLLPNTRLRID